MDRKIRITGFILVAVLACVHVPAAEAAWQDIVIVPGGEVDFPQAFNQGDRVKISLLVDGGLARVVFMNASQYANWTTNRAESEHDMVWIYDNVGTTQLDKFFVVPANDTYHLVIINKLNVNAGNITAYLEFTIIPPPAIPGFPAMMIFATLSIATAIVAKKVAKTTRSGKGGESRNA
nr:hypothetical protein [Candidatus Sigynarchaeota archaeon]